MATPRSRRPWTGTGNPTRAAICAPSAAGDSVSLAGRHNLTPRDQLSWRAAHNRYSSRDGDALGSGFAFNLELSHMIFFEGPTWQVRSGITYQQNSARSTLPASVTRYLQPLAGSGENGEVTVADLEALGGTQLLQDRYGQLYVGSSWRRGIPGSLTAPIPIQLAGGHPGRLAVDRARIQLRFECRLWAW